MASEHAVGWIAQLNTEKDLRLQNDRLYDERLKTEVELERKELRTFHLIFSRLALENSQTMMFWGSQEAALRADIKEKPEAWQSNLQEALRSNATSNRFTLRGI